MQSSYLQAAQALRDLGMVCDALKAAAAAGKPHDVEPARGENRTHTYHAELLDVTLDVLGVGRVRGH